jgi:hypothetical protein
MDPVRNPYAPERVGGPQNLLAGRARSMASGYFWNAVRWVAAIAAVSFTGSAVSARPSS